MALGFQTHKSFMAVAPRGPGSTKFRTLSWLLHHKCSPLRCSPLTLIADFGDVVFDLSKLSITFRLQGFGVAESLHCPISALLSLR
ncbi:hypothetical protein SUGI_0396150 [Cryptomeria japonica]|nr:hypothetical protein SUGI_0396150 [Cryptomeria japonica]